MRDVPALFILVCVLCIAGLVAQRGSAGDEPGLDNTCSPSILIAPFQNGDFIGFGELAETGIPIEYYVVLQVVEECDPVPAGGRLILTLPDGMIVGPPNVPEITADDPFVFGPINWTPTQAWCPLVQASAIYRALDEGFVAANTAINRTGLSSCPGGNPNCPADIDGNGVVDVDDLVAVILGWGPCDDTSQLQEWIEGADPMPEHGCPCGEGHRRVPEPNGGPIETWRWRWTCLDGTPELGHGYPVPGGDQ